jgi:formate hydrogenlyase subunit 4
VVLSTLASPGFLLGPAVVWIAVLAATLLVPLGPAGAAVGFRGDALVLLYLLALARFATAWAALETGSAFEGMGTVREVSYAMLGEAALVAALLALGVHAGSLELGVMLAPPDGLATNPGTGLLAAGLFIILLAENCRVPFDDPNTHLELTMIHEAMVLDHSGPPLAVILHASAMKLLLFAVVLVQAVLPSAGALALAGGVLATVLGVGLVESALARLAFRRVPLLLITAVLLCVFALLLAWRGDAA